MGGLGCPRRSGCREKGGSGLYNGSVSKESKFLSGFVTLIGRPNAGKSTLMNALLGQKVAIVTPHPQTTRTHLLGIYHAQATSDHPAGQIVFVDTPGVHKGRTALNREMMRSVREGLEGRDLALLLVDVTRKFGDEDAFALDLLKSAARAESASPEGEGDGSATRVPTFLVLNKVDRMKDKRALLPIIDTYRERYDFDEILPISAISGEGLPLLLNKIFERLPEGPEYFPAGQVTDQPERFQISEVIREKAMALTREEVPHTLAVQVEKLERGPRMTEISAVLYCERPGQKAILIGHRGEMIRQIGTRSREELEATLGSKVFLELHVLVREEWRENPRFLADLDWRKEVDF